MKSCVWDSLRLLFVAVIVIVCGCARAGRSHIDGRFGLGDAVLGLVTVLVGVPVPVTVVVGILAAAAAWVVVLWLVTIVEPHAHRQTVASASAASIATAAPGRVVNTFFSYPGSSNVSSTNRRYG